MVRRVVAEIYDGTFQTVIVYPAEINKKQVKREQAKKRYGLRNIVYDKKLKKFKYEGE
ncbi:hypothetical protein [Bacillus phage vB_BceS-M2]